MAAARVSALQRTGKLLIGAALIGWGSFNLVEGLVDHFWLGAHHVNAQAAASERMGWDLGFLVWGVAMTLLGAFVYRHARGALVAA